MKILKWFLFVIILFALLIAGYLAYLGVFNSLTVSEKVMDPYTIAAERFVGPYSKTGEVFNKVHSTLRIAGVNGTLGLGIYYDDPQTVPADKLRSDCGEVINPKDTVKLKIFKELKIMTINKSRAVITEFTIKSPLSYMVGPMKAYPALVAYIQKNNLKINSAMYEIYDMPENKIIYVVPIK